MYRIITKNNEFTIPKENLLWLARFHAGLLVKIKTAQDAIDYFKSIGIGVSEGEQCR